MVVEPWDIETLPDYFANLIVSDGMLFSDKISVSRSQAKRVLRPYGGMACVSFHKESESATETADKPVTKKAGELYWRQYVRGPLEGAGN